MNNDSAVLIRWIQKSARPTTHGSCVRKPGDEDIVTNQEAKALQMVGLAKIVGPAESVTVKVLESVEIEETDGTTTSNGPLSPAEG